MSPFEYLLALVSILVGLAVADLAVSLHRLLRARDRIRWDALPLAAALLVLLLILQFWWAFYGVGRMPVWTRYGPFLVLAGSLLAMFLLASAALPDEIPSEGLDLRTYYDGNRRYFWSIFGVFALLAVLVQLMHLPSGTPWSELGGRSVGNLVFALLLFSLAGIGSRRYHSVLLLFLLTALALQWSQLRLQ